MAATLNDATRALFDGKNYATVATLNADGSPQTSVVWVTRDGDDVLFSTVRKRRKDINLSRDPRLSLTIFNIESPFDYVEIRGTVTIDEKGGPELVNTLSHKYLGTDYSYDPPDAVRVVVRVRPEKVTGTLA